MMERGWDPEVKKFFRKILSSFTWGLIWMMCGVAGIYYGWASPVGKLNLQAILFYAGMLIGLLLLLRYLYNTWKKG